jgi:hypothetical protein
MLLPSEHTHIHIPDALAVSPNVTMTVASPDDVSIVAGVNEKSTNFGAFPSCTKFTTGLGVGVAVAVGPDVAGGAGKGVTVGVGTTVGASAKASGVRDMVASGAGVAVGGTS